MGQELQGIERKPEGEAQMEDARMAPGLQKFEIIDAV